MHALSKDAERADLEMQKSGGPTDKDLLLVDQAGLMMDATVSAVSKYMYTGDNQFLVVAKDLDAQTHRVTAALR